MLHDFTDKLEECVEESLVFLDENRVPFSKNEAVASVLEVTRGNNSIT